MHSCGCGKKESIFMEPCIHICPAIPCQNICLADLSSKKHFAQEEKTHSSVPHSKISKIYTSRKTFGEKITNIARVRNSPGITTLKSPFLHHDHSHSLHQGSVIWLVNGQLLIVSRVSRLKSHSSCPYSARAARKQIKAHPTHIS